MNRRNATSDDFEFARGATVRVRVREHGNRGNIEGKFKATVKGFSPGAGASADTVDLDPPWDSVTGVSLGPYDAEYEVLEEAPKQEASEVQ